MITRSIPSQDPTAVSPADQEFSLRVLLPGFNRLWDYIEDETGHAWHATSFWRDSPSHSRGHAIDLAPDIADHSKDHYAVFRGSDPVLYKRTALVRALQRVCRRPCPLPEGMDLGIFIEPDHLHVQATAAPPAAVGRIYLAKWKVAKPAYADTLQRMRLPMLP